MVFCANGRLVARSRPSSPIGKLKLSNSSAIAEPARSGSKYGSRRHIALKTFLLSPPRLGSPTQKSPLSVFGHRSCSPRMNQL